MASAPTALSFTFVSPFLKVHRSAPVATRVPVRSDVMMIVYPETAFEEVIEANRRGTWKINALAGEVKSGPKPDVRLARLIRWKELGHH
jgi:hypothetical protein